MNCNDCVFSHFDEKAEVLNCRRFPPIFHVPVVKPDDFCFEYKVNDAKVLIAEAEQVIEELKAEVKEEPIEEPIVIPEPKKPIEKPIKKAKKKGA